MTLGGLGLVLLRRLQIDRYGCRFGHVNIVVGEGERRERCTEHYLSWATRAPASHLGQLVQDVRGAVEDNVITHAINDCTGTVYSRKL